MKLTKRFVNLQSGRHSAALIAFLALQSVAGVLFIGDAVSEVIENPASPQGVLEALTALALISGVLFGALSLRAAQARIGAQQAALNVASGALVAVIDAQFAQWRLTRGEADVAMLALKGLDVSEIAALRGAANGTVRAQLSSIYAKAGVSGRAQFAAFFVEDLLAGDTGS